MAIPTEPIGSIPRPGEIIEAMAAFAAGEIPQKDLQVLQSALCSWYSTTSKPRTERGSWASVVGRWPSSLRQGSWMISLCIAYL